MLTCAASRTPSSRCPRIEAVVLVDGVGITEDGELVGQADALELAAEAALQKVLGHRAPRPPLTECSSTVKIAPVSSAHLSIIAVSSGLTVCMSITRRGCRASP
jgi:hypothetical protein